MATQSGKGKRQRGRTKRALQPKTPNVSMLYDNALPHNLKYQGVVERRKPGLKLRTDEELPLSPYIIHLSREEKQTLETAAPNLEALAKSLALDTASLEESLEEPVTPKDDLKIEREELLDQLRETDLQITQKKIVREKRESSSPPAPVAPIQVPLLDEATNVREELVKSIKEQEQAAELIKIELPTASEEHFDEHMPVTLKEEEIEEMLEVPRQRKLIRWKLPTFGTTRQRALLAFVFLSFALVLPLQAMQGVGGMRAKKIDITDAGRSAIDNLLRGAAALETDRFDVASDDFVRASDNFSDAESSLNSLNSAVASIVSVLPQTDRTYDSVRGLITAGRGLSDAAGKLASAGREIKSQSSIDLVTKLRILRAYIEAALPEVVQAVEALDDVDPAVVPDDYRYLVEELKIKIPQLEESMQEFMDFSDALTIILGGERKMRYLVVFQNNTELRATGGFAGSFAEMDVLHGQIESIHVPAGGTYDIQGQLSAFVAPPEPLRLINPRWEFHDANWFPDFPSSAKKLLYFYQKAGGPTVDGVIVINATLMPELLEIVGPIEMPEYGRVIDSENFLFETQKIVDIEYKQFTDRTSGRKEEAPKQFIGDLAPKILERLEGTDMPTLLSVLDVLGKGLVQKDVLLYFESNTLQSEMERLGWSGSLKQTSGDYLMVVNTNLGGGKTDSVIDQIIDVDIDVSEDGSIINTITISKKHRGLQNALFEGVNNVDYLRLYVPKGSQLLEASGFEIPAEELFEVSDIPLSIDEDLALIFKDAYTDSVSGTDVWTENGKTVFGNWIQTKPGETEQVQFVYKLPFKLIEKPREQNLLEIAKARLGFKNLETYTLFLQKQPGVKTRTSTINLSLPETLRVIWSSHAGSDETASVSFNNEEDVFIRFLIEHEAH